MATAAQAPAISTTTDPVERWLARRGAINRANSLHSTGPRTEPGKQRSSLNALSHGLTARTAVLPSEDPEAHQRHIQQFLDEYQPATPTETQLVHEIANTAWRLNRIPFLEAALLHRAANPPTDQAAIDFDIVDAHRALATLGLHGSRLSRQFQKALEQLRDSQEAQRVRRAPPNEPGTSPRHTPFCASSSDERRHLERRQLTEAAEIFLRHQHKGLPWQPADLFPEQAHRRLVPLCAVKHDGFVFSKQQIERHARELVRKNPSFYATLRHFQADPPI